MCDDVLPKNKSFVFMDETWICDILQDQMSGGKLSKLNIIKHIFGSVIS